MHSHGGHGSALPAAGAGAIVLLGNANVGKSALFGRLTGRYIAVSNYPGTTVELATGVARLEGREATVIDTPGVANLVPLTDDERVARDVLLNGRPHAVVLVADAKNLERALVLAVQLAEMELPFVLDLNMDDEARARGVAIDAGRLAERLGVPVVRTVAVRGTGVEALRRQLDQPGHSTLRTTYDPEIERAAADIARLLPEGREPGRARALMLLSGDESASAALPAASTARLEALRSRAASHYREPLAYVINEQRLRAARELASAVSAQRAPPTRRWGAFVERLVVHPLAGVPVLLVVLYAVYKFVGELGAGTLVDFMEGTVFGGYLDPWATSLAEATLPNALLRDLFVGEYGVVTMALSYGFAIILPIVGTFFLAFSLLEDSGYLARLVVMANRPMKAMGLNGRAVLPMVLGLGCVTMATMTTRTLETRKERLQATLLLALAIPCSAQLGVVLGILGELGTRATAVWLGVVAATLFTVGYLAARVIPGERSDFVQELPPMRVPQLSNVIAKTVARIEWYLREVIPLFIAGTVILFVLDRAGVLSAIEAGASPLVQGFLGLPGAATTAFVMGFLRRDYGAAGLFVLMQQGELDPVQALVALVVITLFVPCIANVLMIVKEHGLRTAAAVTVFVFPFAVLVGGALNLAIRTAGIGL